jgi:dihydrofolate reductase
MRKIILSMQMTLDGYVSGPNGEMDWIYTGTAEWDDMRKELDNADTYLIGAKMFPEYSEHWRKQLTNPGAPAEEKSFAELADKTQHVVFSKSLEQTGLENYRIARDVDSEVSKLKQEPGKNILLWGGASLARYFIEKGLLDEIRLVIVPMMLGAGKRLFPDDGERRRLEMISMSGLDSGVVIVRFRVK